MKRDTAACQLDHVNIVVGSLERSIRFYQDLLGLQPAFRTVLEGSWIDRITGLRGAVALCTFMETEGCPVRLELLEYINPPGVVLEDLHQPHLRGVRHLAFTVDDLMAFCRRAEAAGVRFLSEPVEVPFPLPGGRTKRLCYFYDPDGVLLEAAEYSESA